jgi:hypothetical protein
MRGLSTRQGDTGDRRMKDLPAAARWHRPCLIRKSLGVVGRRHVPTVTGLLARTTEEEGLCRPRWDGRVPVAAEFLRDPRLPFSAFLFFFFSSSSFLIFNLLLLFIY